MNLPGVQTMLLNDISDDILLFLYTGETAKYPIFKFVLEEACKKGGREPLFMLPFPGGIISTGNPGNLCSLPFLFNASEKNLRRRRRVLHRPEDRDRFFAIVLS